MKQHAPTGSILVTDSIAMRALAVLLREKAGEITEAFPAFFVQEAVDAVEKRTMSELPKWIADWSDVVISLGEGGILNGLWTLCEELNTGCEVLLKEIPIRQETVEICELFNINPLYADSTGAYIIASTHGYELQWLLKRAGIEAALIGVLLPGPSRTIRSGEDGEHVRHLDRPQREELTKVISNYQAGSEA